MYRIFTENIDKQHIIDLCGNDFPKGFTIIEADGYYEGTQERSVIVEILANQDEKIKKKINALALKIKKLNNQDTMLVQYVPNTHWFV
jgi:hypothetical protein